MSERRSDVEDVDESEYVLGGDNHGESEVERICRVLLVCKLDERIEPLRTLGEEIVDAGLGGEDVTAEDIDALRKAMTELEYVLQDYAEPLVDEDKLNRDRLNPVRDD